jgi:transposase
MSLSIPLDQKKKAISELLRKDTPWKLIQKELGVAPNTISEVSRSMKTIINYTPSPKTIGAPVKITNEIRTFIDAETLKNSLLGTKKLARLIHQRFDVEVSYESVRLARRSLKFLFKRLRKRPLLTEAHIATRLRFCGQNLSSEIDWSRDVVISDESRFCLYSDNKMGWVKRGAYNDSSYISTPKFQGGIMCWGAIGRGYKSPLLFFDSTVDVDTYISTLQKYRIFESMLEILKDRVTIFQQDGAPAH